MKTPFKVGDRVRAYEHLSVRVGTIDAIDTKDNIRFKDGSLWYHPKQCRRLKYRPKPLTMFISGDSIPQDNECKFHASVAGPEWMAEQRRRGSKAIWHEFREVVTVKERTDGQG